MYRYLTLTNSDPGPVHSFNFIKLQSGNVFKYAKLRYDGVIPANIIVSSLKYSLSTGFDEALLLYSLPPKAVSLVMEYLIEEWSM